MPFGNPQRFNRLRPRPWHERQRFRLKSLRAKTMFAPTADLGCLIDSGPRVALDAVRLVDDGSSLQQAIAGFSGPSRRARRHPRSMLCTPPLV
jgi:hypothetical protein